MGKIIEMRLQRQQGEADIYTKGGILPKTYIRQPAQDKNNVQWMIAKKVDNGFAAGKPLKAGVCARVVRGKRKEKETVFEELMLSDEVGTSYCDKNHPFVGEQLQAEGQTFARENGLHDYEAWKKWLLVDCVHYNYKGNDDNWLYFAALEIASQVVAHLDIQGHPYIILETQWRHQVSHKTWSVYEIKDRNDNVVVLCGIGYLK